MYSPLPFCVFASDSRLFWIWVACQVSEGLQLRLHVGEGRALGVEVGLRTAGIGVELLALRERLVVVVDAARGDRILRRRGERLVGRQLIVGLRNTLLERTDRGEELVLAEAVGDSHGHDS
jgi:hypothetical protein